jgi:Ca2+-binding EF-hand superfamily protein
LAINVTSSGTPEQKLEWAFRMYDIDGNGTIDEKEMVKIIEVRKYSLFYIYITECERKIEQMKFYRQFMKCSDRR